MKKEDANTVKAVGQGAGRLQSAGDSSTHLF